MNNAFHSILDLISNMDQAVKFNNMQRPKRGAQYTCGVQHVFLGANGGSLSVKKVFFLMVGILIRLWVRHSVVMVRVRVQGFEMFYTNSESPQR